MSSTPSTSKRTDSDSDSERIKVGPYIFLPRELAKNKLVYRYKNTNRRLKDYPEHEITNKVRNIILQFSEKKPLNQDTYDKLNDNEKTIIDQFVILTKLGSSDRKLINAVSKVDTDINRFNVLRGELLAGNTSSVIITELKLLILKLSKGGLISDKDCSNLLYLLCTV